MQQENNEEPVRLFLISLYYKTQEKIVIFPQKEGKVNTIMCNTVLKKKTMVTFNDIVSFVKHTEPNVLPHTIAFTGLYEFKSDEEAAIFFGEDLKKVELNEKTDS